MSLIAARLRHEGYAVINNSYPSREKTLPELSAHLRGQLEAAPAFRAATRVHFVTHSMGGLVARYFLHEHRPANLGNVVMLSPPNQGSEFADFMREQETLKNFYSRVFGPAGEQLTTDFNHAVGPVDYPLGIIAGTLSINPLAGYVLPDGGAHDGIVPVARMKIEGMTDMIEVPATHSLMMFNPAVGRQVSHFLKHQTFNR